MGRYIITINVYRYNMYIYIYNTICMALKHIKLIGQAIYIVTLKHHGLSRPEEMIRHDQRTAAYLLQSLTAVVLCIMIINNSVVFTEIFIIYKRSTLIVLNRIYNYFLLSEDRGAERDHHAIWKPFDKNVYQILYLS